MLIFKSICFVKYIKMLFYWFWQFNIVIPNRHSVKGRTAIDQDERFKEFSFAMEHLQIDDRDSNILFGVTGQHVFYDKDKHKCLCEIIFKK